MNINYFKTKKIFITLLALQFFIMAFSPIAAKATDMPNIKLSFTPKHMVISSDKETLYAINTNDKSVQAINISTGDIKSVAFNYAPERLYFANNKLYVAISPNGHNSYIDESDEKGIIAIVNPQNFTIEKQFDVNIDPFDIAVDNNNIIYITSGSSQWTNFKNYSLLTTKEISTVSIRMRSYLEYNPILKKLYTITTDTSPRDISSNSVGAWGKMTSLIDSPYHGDYNMYENIKISPDGNYIFNGSGTIFRSSVDLNMDMKYVCDINEKFDTIAFNNNSTEFYISNTNGVIKAFNYTSFNEVSSYDLGSTISYLFDNNNSLIACYTDKDYSFNIKTILKDSFTQSNLPPKIVGDISKVVYSPKNDKAYAINKSFMKLYTIDTRINLIENSIDLPYIPSSICLSEDESKLFIANNSYDCIATEYNLSTKTLRNLKFNSATNYDDTAEKKIYEKNNILYVVTGEWSPKLYAFNSTTFENINYGSNISEVGGMAFTKDNKYFYTWSQYGWSAGVASTGLTKYLIENNTFTQVSSYSYPYPEVNRDPLFTPILLNEDTETITFKNLEINMNDLSNYKDIYPESIFDINPTKTVAASNTGLYLLKYNIFSKFNSTSNLKVLFFDKNGALYVQDKSNNIYIAIPIEGDINGDTIVDILDVTAIANSYNSKSSDISYNFIKDLNFDGIIDIYDLTLSSKKLVSTSTRDSKSMTNEDSSKSLDLKLTQIEF